MQIHIQKALIALLFFALSGFIPEVLNAVQGQTTAQIQRVTLSELQQNFYKADLEMEISVMLDEVTLDEALSHIAKEAGLKLTYRGDILNERSITLQREAMSVNEALEYVLGGTGLDYRYSREGYLLITQTDEIFNESVQQETIYGQVSDAQTGEPLPGVSILVEGTNIGTATDLDGMFELEVPSLDETLVISYIGYEQQIISIDGRMELEVAMQSAILVVDELVVVGYGSMHRRDLTGSISSVSAREIDAFPASNPLITLQGRAPGVEVRQSTGHPGSQPSVRIRGTNSIRGDNEPLYVIDGVPSSPYVLDNADIESIEVLKDASATAIYGNRGANGVIIITTKSGAEGRTSVDFESNISFQQLRTEIDLMNAREYAEYYKQLFDNNPASDQVFTPEMIESYGKGTNWQDFMFRTAPIQTHSLRISGGDENTQFSVGGNIYNQDGIIENSGYSRYSTRINFNHRVNDRFSVNLSTVLSNRIQTLQDSDRGRMGSSVVSAILNAPPIFDPYDEDGNIYNFSDFEDETGMWISPAMGNPLRFVDLTKGQDKRRELIGNAQLNYNILDDLQLRVRGAINNTDGRFDRFNRSDFDEQQRESNASVTTINNSEYYIESLLEYLGDFGSRNSFGAMVGFTYENFVSESLSGSGRDFLSDITESHNLATANIPGVPASSFTESTLLSYLGRVNYNFDDTYMFTGSMRYDGTSKYSPGEKWGYFPSMAIAWRLEQNTFIGDIDFISHMKLRLSWGVTGSQAVGPYQTLSRLAAGRTPFGNSIVTTLAPGWSSPSNLTWEKTEQINIGVDATFLNDNVNINADYYIKNTSDLLNIVGMPSSSGFQSSLQNIGEMQNKGFEFSASATLITTPSARWDISGNITFNRNEIVSLHEGRDIITGNYNLGGGSFLLDNLVILREGEPVGAFFGFIEDGYTEDGTMIKYKDLNGDGILTEEDKRILGDPNPDFTFGFDTSISYQGFNLSAFFQGSYGNNIANISALTAVFDSGYYTNLLREVGEDYWTPDYPNAKYPKPFGVSPTLRFSDRMIEDGSYLRLQSIQLGYTFTDFMGIRNGRIYISGQNLLTLTNYSWWDPEVNSEGGQSLVQGVDFNTYPMTKSYTIGIALTF